LSYVPPHKRRVDKDYNAATVPDRSGTDEIFFCEAFSFVRCINLARRSEQWDRFCHHGRRIGSEFLKKVVRFDAVDGKEAILQLQGVAIAASDVSEDANITRKSAASISSTNSMGRIGIDVAWEWDTTQNSLWDRHVAPGIIRQMTAGEIGCALSHISLWKELAKNETEDRESTIGSNGCIQNETDKEQAIQPDSLSMLILEDDAAFLEQSHRRYTKKGYSEKVKQIQSAGDKSGDRFLKAFRTAHNILPGDWDIFYLGFSDRGERRDVISSRTAGDFEEEDDFVVQIFKPIYGFHTHAYAINQSASKKLLQNLPVVGPIDVWLADNQWFGLNVYCVIVANEGWKNSGTQLVGQDRSVAIASSVGHSGRRQNRPDD